jgi:VanZ family protein
MKKIDAFKIFLTITITYAIVIFYLSSKSSIEQPRDVINLLEVIGLYLYNHGLYFVKDIFQFAKHNLDKIEHFTLYAGFGVLLFFTIHHSKRPALQKYAPILAILIGTAYGATDEFHQYFTPGRSESLADLAADIYGVTFGQLIAIILLRLQSTFHTKKTSTAPGAKP